MTVFPELQTMLGVFKRFRKGWWLCRKNVNEGRVRSDRSGGCGRKVEGGKVRLKQQRQFL